MSSIKKAAAIGMATISLWAVPLTPGFAQEAQPDINGVVASEQSARSLLNLTEVISFGCGFKLKVNYTTNDGYGIITNIRSTSTYYCPSDVKSPSWTYQKMNGGSYYRFTLYYTYNGVSSKQYANLWA